MRKLLSRLPLSWADVLLTAGLLVAGLVWVANAHPNDGPSKVSVVVAVRPGTPTPPAAPAPLTPPVPGDATGPGNVAVAPQPADPPDPDAPKRAAGLDPYKYVLESDHPGGLAYAVTVLATVPLLVRRRWPYVTAVLSLGGVLALRDGLVWPAFLAVMIAAYSVVAYGRRLWLSLSLLGVAACVAARVFSTSIPDMPGWFSPFALLAPIGLAAATIRNARARADASARRAVALEHEQEAVARAAIAEERARIARELHDVVSHHVSVMIVQAGAAGKVLDTRPDLAANALTAIEASGREAMGELRQLLGLMTPPDDRLHPQPGLDDLPSLVESVRSAGQPVTLTVAADELPRAVELTAYRVIQEGLTNALRYAPGAPTAAAIRRDGDDLVVEVRNSAPALPAAAPTAGGAGRGLVGLAERVRLHGGTLEHGRRVGGGFLVTARIPVPAPVVVG